LLDGISIPVPSVPWLRLPCQRCFDSNSLHTDSSAQGKGRYGLILTGHDHEGCDVWHYIPSNTTWSDSTEHSEKDGKTHWEAVPWRELNQADHHTGVREVTLRSMMGDYGGNAGLLSMWFNFSTGEWEYAISMCGLDVRLWWAVHVMDLLVLALFLSSLVSFIIHTHSDAKLQRVSNKHDERSSDASQTSTESSASRSSKGTARNAPAK